MIVLEFVAFNAISVRILVIGDAVVQTVVTILRHQRLG